MMAVSHIGYAQYPKTKTINGVDVVIMTIPQAEQIDIKFNKLKDTINIFKNKIYNGENIIKTLNKEKNALIDSIYVYKNNIVNANHRISKLEEENKRIEKLEFVEKRTRVKLYVGLGVAIATWVSILILGVTMN